MNKSGQQPRERKTLDHQVLHEDESIVVVYKPPGLLSQEDETGDPDLVTLLKKRYQRSENRFVGLVHRLDRPASGVMVFARSSTVAAALCAQIAENQFGKAYLAVVHGAPPATGHLEDNLVIDPEARKSSLVTKSNSRSLAAVMDYNVLGSHGNRTLIEVQLFTGRRHQIRAQLSERGYPIVGDRKYGSREVLRDPGMIALCAWRLEFDHPADGRRMQWHSPRPQHWPWFDPKLFQKQKPAERPVKQAAANPPRDSANTSGRPKVRQKKPRSR